MKLRFTVIDGLGAKATRTVELMVKNYSNTPPTAHAGLAVSVRRRHDTNRSGWWILTGLVPILGWIALLIFYVEDSRPGANQYGPHPKGV